MNRLGQQVDRFVACEGSESTVSRERADESESTEKVERAATSESTVDEERKGGLRVALSLSDPPFRDVVFTQNELALAVQAFLFIRNESKFSLFPLASLGAFQIFVEIAGLMAGPVRPRRDNGVNRCPQCVGVSQ